jgi:hypothetical protein
MILSHAQIRALLCSSKSKFILAQTLTLLVLDKKTGLWVGSGQDLTAWIFGIHQSLFGDCQKVCWQIIDFIIDLLTRVLKRCQNNIFTLVNSSQMTLTVAASPSFLSQTAHLIEL